jgi:hypothetical protein
MLGELSSALRAYPASVHATWVKGRRLLLLMWAP